jgi:hypothetical protein
MSYDVFISYSSKDRDWGQRLYQDLSAKGLSPFLDQENLHAGDQWSPALKDALSTSKYFLALWSTHAKESRWVDHEAVYFERRLEKPNDATSSMHQRMLFVLLNEDNSPYNDIQMVRDLKEAQVYELGIESAATTNPGLWQRVIEKIYAAITSDEQFIPIPLLIVTTTRERLAQVNFQKTPDHLPFSPSLDTVLGKMGSTKEDLLERYGSKRTDWKPIGSKLDIMTLLNADRDKINEISSAKFRWDPLGERFWSNLQQEEVIREIRRLETPNLGVIVLDPLAICDVLTYQRFNMLSKCFDNENAVIVALSPFSMPAPCSAFRDAVRYIAMDLFNDWKEPGIRHIPYARCEISFDDEFGFKRALVSTFREHTHKVQPRPVHRYLMQ